MILPLAAGYGLDLLLGDPRWLAHPVVGFGRLISFGERMLNKGRARLLKGALLTLCLCGATFAGCWGLLAWVKGASLPGYYLLSALIVFFCLANRSLLQEGREVFDVLEKEGLEAGRKRLSWIVGRDTAQLSAQQVRIAVLESMSENLSDGVVAPLLWYFVGGAPAMLTYKMINTLDSMIGYKREPYRLFGRFAARLDDVANFIPARVTAMLMALVAFSGRALRFAFRYGPAHASPNSGWPEAALAGILNCRFGGPNRYAGLLVEKPYIGECERVIRHEEFGRVRYVNHAVSFFVVIAGIVYFLL